MARDVVCEVIEPKRYPVVTSSQSGYEDWKILYLSRNEGSVQAKISFSRAALELFDNLTKKNGIIVRPPIDSLGILGEADYSCCEHNHRM